MNVPVKLAQEYAGITAVEAIALAGSRSGPFAQETSDYDLYVYSREPLTMPPREAIARKHCPTAETGNRFWEPGDEWREPSGERIDVMFRDTGWMEDHLARVLDHFEASIGYSTAFWFNVKTSQCLFDRSGWFPQLQRKAAQAYPDELRRNIIAKNHPILRSTQSSYTYQIQQALRRDDPVSVNHRVSALLARNRQPHPGEKRLLQWSVELCPLRPKTTELLVKEILSHAGECGPKTVGLIHMLLDALDDLLRTEKLI